MLGLILLSAALAADAPPAQAATTRAAEPKRDRMVCRRIEETGTRMGAREICKNQSQWDDDKTQAENLLRDKQLRDLDNPVPLTPAAPQ